METKQCNRCSETKLVTEFHKGTNGAKHLAYCKSCRKIESAAKYRKDFWAFKCRLKRSEAKKKGWDFDLTPEYLEEIYTGVCPVYGVPFVMFDKHHPNCPTLDRMDSSKGYVKGNVNWISFRANRIKYDATPEELKMILDYMTKELT